MIEVGVKKDGSPRLIPTDSRFLDDDHFPKDRYMSRNGKPAGGILMTTATTSTAPWKRLGSFTHHVDQSDIEHAIANNGEYQIDAPEKQIAAAGAAYKPPKGSVKGKLQYARGGSVDDDGDDESDSMEFPERNFTAQMHNSHRREEAEGHAHPHANGVIDRAMHLVAHLGRR
jgi:hypothetical protein